MMTIEYKWYLPFRSRFNDWWTDETCTVCLN